MSTIDLEKITLASGGHAPPEAGAAPEMCFKRSRRLLPNREPWK